MLENLNIFYKREIYRERYKYLITQGRVFNSKDTLRYAYFWLLSYWMRTSDFLQESEMKH